MNRHEQESIVNADDLQGVCSQLYQKVGVAKTDADTIAEMQVLMDLRGVHSHATRGVPGYVRSVMSGDTNPTPQIKVLEDNPASVLLDGDRGLGHLVGIRAMNLAIEKAKSASIGMAVVRNSKHFGAASSHAMRTLEHDMIGFATTNGGGANVAVFGAMTNSIGNNALSYAIPTEEEPPIVLDMACGAVAAGRIGTARIYNEKIPLGWGLDENGEETDDPSKVAAILPAAGPKGSALAMVMDVLCGPLSGGLMGINKKYQPGDAPPEKLATAHFFLAINIASLTSVEEFKAEIDRQIRMTRQAKPRKGFDRVTLPGEIEWELTQERRANGIPLHKSQLQNLEALAGELGVPVPWKGK
ncbi:MAG: Ldh family oxidoreductase [Candidatus Poribacteria bacterium]|nr:Ldh family oxidoreductase [Candidatus Poribacteria bacterium]